jgi:hypothetical protein
MTMSEKRKVATSFGQEVDLSDLEGFDIQELLASNTDLLKIEGGDPNYEYGWMDVRDPMHAYKIRKGLWEQVDADKDDVICAGSVKDGGAIRVNELMLVRMPKDRFRKIRLAWDAISLAKESKISARFKGEMDATGRALGDDPNTTITNDEKVGVAVKYAGKEK